MALNTLLIIAAGLGAGPGQDPSIDTQIATPVAQKVYATTYAPQSSEKITVQFRDTKPAEVLSWLEKHGVNFVVGNGELSDSAKVTLNVQDQPIDDVVNAIARALGGHWERENGIRVFKKGTSMVFSTPGDMPSFPSFEKLMPLGKDGKSMKDGDWDKTFGKDFQKNFGPEFQKKMELFSKDMAGKFSPDMLEKLQKEGSDVRVFSLDKDGVLKLQKDGKLSKEDLEKLKKQSADMRDQAAKIRIEVQKQMKDGKFFGKDGDGKVFAFPDGKTFSGKVFGDKEGTFKFFGKDGDGKVFAFPDGKAFDGKIFGDMKGGKFFHDMKEFNGHSFGLGGNLDVKAFMDSLTSDQEDKQKKRGYIRYSDLTPDQKKKLGDRPDGKFEITFKVNGDQITIRND